MKASAAALPYRIVAAAACILIHHHRRRARVARHPRGVWRQRIVAAIGAAFNRLTAKRI